MTQKSDPSTAALWARFRFSVVGSLLSFVLMPLGWRWMFLIVGAAGVLLAVVWWSIHRDPSEVPLTPDELYYLTEGDENTNSRPPSLAE